MVAGSTALDTSTPPVSTRDMPNTIESTSRVTRSRDLLSTPVDHELVILNLKRDNYLGLDEIGRRIWELLETPQLVEELCHRLSQEFDAVPETIRADVLPFLNELAAEGLVNVVDDRPE